MRAIARALPGLVVVILLLTHGTRIVQAKDLTASLKLGKVELQSAGPLALQEPPRVDTRVDSRVRVSAAVHS